MNSVFSALVAALKTLYHPRMLSLVLWPMLVAIVLWAGAAIVFWGNWVNDMTGLIRATPLQQWMAQGFLAAATHYLIAIVLVLLLPLVLMAYLNQRLFRYDALAEHADKEEYARIVDRSAARFYLLGLAVSLLQFVPLLNLLSPVYVALAFIHLSLAELKQLRMTD